MAGERKPKSARRIVINLRITLLVGLIYFYFKLPALNLQNPGFYGMVFVLAFLYCILSVLSLGLLKEVSDGAGLWRSVRINCTVPVVICAVLIGIFAVGWLSGVPLLRAKGYAQLIDVTESNFAEDIDEISFDQIPMLDSDSAQVLADRKLGELSDLVSQFEVDDSTVQINYRGRPVRVTYLNYGDLFKWFNNVSHGLPAYICLDMVSQEVTVRRLEQGMRYSPSEYFFRDVERHLRFQYPTYLVDEVNFEIDEEGTPYWVAGVATRRIGLFSGNDIRGAVLMNAISGECTYYDVADVPRWVDRVYPADLIIQQYNYHGAYHLGFWNHIFGQRQVTVTTEGYNYIAQDNDVWLYTGITSVTGDESNIGFILVNQRTKQARYYAIAGAEEYSAMNSAKGAVQQYSYTATFPLLLNISGQPTYFVALKDASQLVKMYAMVNVQQYQLVATGPSVSECRKNYVNLLTSNDIDLAAAEQTGEPVTGTVGELRSAVLDGTTRVYIRLEGQTYWYVVSAADSETAVLLNAGDRLSIRSAEDDGELRTAWEVTRTGRAPDLAAGADVPSGTDAEQSMA